jgi:YegS/Rv2252/BmrU family lipid kinase
MLIYNSAAGQRDLYAAVEDAAGALRARGWEIDLRSTAVRGHARLLGREAAQLGLDVVLVAGGDGTINEAINGLAHTPVALGVLPTGTANVWAQEIGLPVPNLFDGDAAPLLACANMLAEGDIRTLDLGQIGERYFMLYGSVGFDAHVVNQIESQKNIKSQLGGLAYYLAGAAAAWQFNGTRTWLTIDGKKMQRSIWAVMAANTQLYGGVMRVAANAIADDGLLDIVVVEGYGPLATMRHFASFILRGIWADPQVEVYRGRKVDIRTRRPMPVQVDGDPAGTTPITIQVVPSALRVLVPRGVAHRIFSEPAKGSRPTPAAAAS